MKKILSVVLLLTLSVASYAQDNVTKFLGIPVDGSKTAMIQKLKGKGFEYNEASGLLNGEFNGEKVSIFISTIRNKVWRIGVRDRLSRDAGQITIRYNTLCEQFEGNPKYELLSKETLPESKEISYEMLTNKKQYAAVYAQLPYDSNILNRLVWFAIFEEYGKYSITIYYDNELNRAHGEDL